MHTLKTPPNTSLSPAARGPIRVMQGVYTLMVRLYAELLGYQWLRELTQNCLEAGAKNIYFHRHEPSWIASGHRKRMIVDDGTGMDPETLARVTANLAASGKKVGLTKNIGIGAKISLLPWNERGIVYVSLKDGVTSMAWIQVDTDLDTAYFRDLQADAGLTPLFIDDDHRPVVFQPGFIDGVDWAATLPEFVTASGSGTCVILMGDSPDANTLTGDLTREANAETTSVLVDAIDSRYFTIPDDVNVSMRRLNADGSLQHNARAYGFRGKLRNFKERGMGMLEGSVEVTTAVNGQDVPATIHWVLLDEKHRNGKTAKEWFADANAKHMLAPCATVVYANEIFGREYGKHDRRAERCNLGYAGISYSEVQQHCYVFVEPRPYDENTPDLMGAAMNTARGGLLLCRNGVAIAELPLRDWLGAFGQDLPEAIRERIAAEASLRKDDSFDEDIFIDDLFRESTKMAAYRVRPKGTAHITPVGATAGTAEGATPVSSGAGTAGGKRAGNSPVTGAGAGACTSGTKTREKVVSIAARLGGAVAAGEVEIFKSQIPEVRMLTADEFAADSEEDRAYIARWTPGAAESPGVIEINMGDPLFAGFLDVVASEAGLAPWMITEADDIARMRDLVFQRAAISGVVGALLRDMYDIAGSPLAVSMTCLGEATLMAHLRRILDLRRPAKARARKAS